MYRIVPEGQYYTSQRLNVKAISVPAKEYKLFLKQKTSHLTSAVDNRSLIRAAINSSMSTCSSSTVSNLDHVRITFLFTKDFAI